MSSDLYQIACASLERCVIDGRVVASPTHYSDYWARDTFWALRGVIRAGYHELAKSSLQLFLDYQRTDGKIPRKLAREYTSLKYTTGIKIRRSTLKPVYRGIIPPFHSMDDNALLVIALGDYLAETGDTDFCASQYENIRRPIEWYEGKKDKRGLIYEYFLANWMDSVFKVGAVLYTNVLYAQALSAMASIARALDHDEDEAIFTKKAEHQRELIREHFWTGSFFRDIARPRNDRFDTAGNLLAVWFDVVDGDERIRVLKQIREMRQQRLLRLTKPWYGLYRINPLLTTVGASDYHNGAAWLWIDILHAMCEAEIGHPEHTHQVRTTVEDIAGRDGEIGETYFRDGSQYDRRFWHTATPFAWASGMLLEYVTVNK